MKKIANLLLLSTLTLGLISCGGSDDDDNDPVQPEVRTPTENQDEDTDNDDENGRRTRTLKTTDCVDNPDSVTSQIRKEKKNGQKSKLYYYDCPGGESTCTRAFEIKTSEIAEEVEGGGPSTENMLNCLQHASDRNIFEVCARGAIIYDGEERAWEYVVFEGFRNGTAVSLQCETNYPKHDSDNAL